MKYFVLLSVFILSSCAMSQKNKEIPFEVVQQSEYGAELPKQQILIRTEEAFQAKLKEVYASHSAIPDIAPIDFDQNDVIFVHRGTFNTGGHDFQIENVVWKEDDLILKIDQNKPKSDMVTMAFTHPFAFIKIKKLKQEPNSIQIEK